MKYEGLILELKKRGALRVLKIFVARCGVIYLAKTGEKYNGHEVLLATIVPIEGCVYDLFVYNDKDDFNDRKNWEIFDKGNCYGKDGIIKQWETMKILNSGLNG